MTHTAPDRVLTLKVGGSGVTTIDSQAADSLGAGLGVGLGVGRGVGRGVGFLVGVGVGVAVGTTVALSQGSPSRPPGSH